MKAGITILLLFIASLLQATPCGVHGSAKSGTREYLLNPYKNRLLAPHTVNTHITLEALASGKQFKNSEAAAIVGYVVLVKPGGRESCNCGAKDAAHRDTHIALVKTLADTNNKRKHIIVEVTPRSRSRY